MTNNIKSWKITYKHPSTGEEIQAIVPGETKEQARAQAIKDNVPTYRGTFFWKIVSIEEVKE